MIKHLFLGSMLSFWAFNANANLYAPPTESGLILDIGERRILGRPFSPVRMENGLRPFDVSFFKNGNYVVVRYEVPSENINMTPKGGIQFFDKHDTPLADTFSIRFSPHDYIDLIAYDEDKVLFVQYGHDEKGNRGHRFSLHNSSGELLFTHLSPYKTTNGYSEYVNAVLSTHKNDDCFYLDLAQRSGHIDIGEYCISKSLLMGDYKLNEVSFITAKVSDQVSVQGRVDNNVILHTQTRKDRGFILKKALFSGNGNLESEINIGKSDYRRGVKHNHSPYGSVYWSYTSKDRSLNVISSINDERHESFYLIDKSPDTMVAIKDGICMIQQGSIRVLDHELNKKSYEFKYGVWPEPPHYRTAAYAFGNSLKIFWLEGDRTYNDRINFKKGERELNVQTLSFDKFQLTDSLQNVVNTKHADWLNDPTFMKGIEYFYTQKFSAAKTQFLATCDQGNEYACYWLNRMRYHAPKSQNEKTGALSELQRLTTSGNLFAVTAAISYSRNENWIELLHPEKYLKDEQGRPVYGIESIFDHSYKLGSPQFLYSKALSEIGYLNSGYGKNLYGNDSRQKAKNIETKEILERLTLLGHPEGIIEHAKWLHLGLGGTTDIKRSEKLLNELKDQGNKRASELLLLPHAERFKEPHYSQQPPQLDEEYIKRLQESAKDGSLGAATLLASIAMKKGDTELANSWIEKTKEIYGGYSPIDSHALWEWAKHHPDFSKSTSK